MELKTVKDEFDRVAKKQKLSHSISQETVDRLFQEIEKTLNTIQGAAADADDPLHHKSVVADLKIKVKDIYPSKQLESTQKELNAAQTKYLKALEKTLTQDISKAYLNIEFDHHILNQIIAQFLYRLRMLDIGDSFISESGEPEYSGRNSFMELCPILEAMTRGDLGPAFNWVASNSDKLKQANSDLEMRLHSLQFLELGKDKNYNEAIDYARKHMSPHLDDCFREIKKLMCSLLWNRTMDKSRLAEFHSPTLWTKTAKELTRQYCNLLGESSECPLSVTIAAGSQALPLFLKYLNLMVNRRQEWQKMEELPLDVKLSDDLVFHSVFICPVNREESSEDNPPMMLPCGHCLCKNAINTMSSNGSFKCPLCPLNIHVSECDQLYF